MTTRDSHKSTDHFTWVILFRVKYELLYTRDVEYTKKQILMVVRGIICEMCRVGQQSLTEEVLNQCHTLNKITMKSQRVLL